MSKAAALQHLEDWSRRGATWAAERDPLIAQAIQDGATDTEISQASSVSRTTIGQIRNPDGPLALREAARRALRNKGITVPRIYTTGGEVRLYLPDDESDDWITRMNWAGAVIATLRDARIMLIASDEPHGDDLQNHLAHVYEQHAVLAWRKVTD